MTRHWRRPRTGPQPESGSADTSNAAADDSVRDEIKAFTEQGRWLLEYHNKRNDGIAERAVAMLGFTGVILALIPTALALPTKIHHTAGLWIALITTVVGLLATAFLCLIALRIRRTATPGATYLRSLLHHHTTGARVGKAHRDIAETLLYAVDLGTSSPIDLASNEATARARTFKWATLTLVLALGGIAALVLQLFTQMGGGAK